MHLVACPKLNKALTEKLAYNYMNGSEHRKHDQPSDECVDEWWEYLHWNIASHKHDIQSKRLHFSPGEAVVEIIAKFSRDVTQVAVEAHEHQEEGVGPQPEDVLGLSGEHGSWDNPEGQHISTGK